MRLVFAGTPEAAIPSLEAIRSSPHDLAAVVTRPDAPSGRGRRLHPSPVADWADAAGLEVLKPERASAPEFSERLRALAPDCCPVVAYGALLREQALRIPLHGWINLHFSVLPAWRGAAPVQHAIMAGDDVTGATTFRIVRELDAGPVFGWLTEPIGPADTAGDLLDRLSRSGAKLLLDTLDGIESGSLQPQPQPEEGVSYATKVTAADAEVHWSAPAFAIDRLIRSCEPVPGAWTTFRGERLKLGPVTVLDTVHDEEPLEPGVIDAGKRRVRVGTGSTPIALGEVQAVGKRPVPAADWARGHRPDEGERLG